MKGLIAVGMMVGGVAGVAATAALIESMHPGMMNRDRKKVMKKAKNMMHFN